MNTLLDVIYRAIQNYFNFNEQKDTMTNVRTVSPTKNFSLESASMEVLVDANEELLIFAILFFVPVKLPLVTDDVSREMELLPDEIGLGNWLMLDLISDSASSNKIRRASWTHDILKKKKSIQLLNLGKHSSYCNDTIDIGVYISFMIHESKVFCLIEFKCNDFICFRMHEEFVVFCLHNKYHIRQYSILFTIND